MPPGLSLIGAFTPGMDGVSAGAAAAAGAAGVSPGKVAVIPGRRVRVPQLWGRSAAEWRPEPSRGFAGFAVRWRPS